MRISLTFLCLFIQVVFGQDFNLVPNSGFDETKGSKKRNTHRPWRFVNTVDVYHEGKMMRPPRGTEKWEAPKPVRGTSYAGIRIYPEYREFLQVELKDKLKQGQRYYFEMWISDATGTNYYLKQIGASFTRRRVAYTSKTNVLKYPPQINYVKKKGLRTQTDTTQWYLVTGVFKARGNERYLTIGNFSEKRFKDRFKKKKLYIPDYWKFQAYYYVDEVTLMELKDAPKKEEPAVALADSSVHFSDTNLTPIEEENYIFKLNTEKRVVLEKVRFEFSSSELSNYSFDELELVLEYLHNNPTARIIIEGHTDDIGSEDANEKMSERRAKSVYKYLVKNEVSKERLSYVGMGENHPIATNETGEGRSRNRRVELVLDERVIPTQEVSP